MVPVTTGNDAPHGTRVVALSRLRRRIGENLIRSRRTAAHVWASVEVDYQALETVRQKHRAEFREREGAALTYLPFVARAAVDALAAFPAVNSSIDTGAGTQTLHGTVNLGIAVDLDQNGLVVVTVRDAGRLALRPLARRINALAANVHEGRLGLEDVGGSTFTITNPGAFGSHLSAPIINLPNVAIVSVDAVTKRPIVIEGAGGSDTIAIHHVGSLGLSWDHRAFDGSTAVAFLKRIRDHLQTRDWERELA